MRNVYGPICREFHQALPQLLKPDGLYSFFNGLAADNAFFHNVCCRVVAAELARWKIYISFKGFSKS